MSSASLIREALNRQPCPACRRRHLMAGFLRPRRAHCMFCGHRFTAPATIVKRRGRLRVEFGERLRLERGYGGHRA